MDGSHFTLRELTWMADGRQQAEWWRGCVLHSRLKEALTGEWVEPNELMPERYRAKPKPVKRTPEQEARETRCALMLLGGWFGDRGRLGDSQS